VASIRFSRQAHGADVREQGVVAAMNSVPQGDPASNSKAPPEGDRRGLISLADEG